MVSRKKLDNQELIQIYIFLYGEIKLILKLRTILPLVSSTGNMCSTIEQPGSNILSNEFNFIFFNILITIVSNFNTILYSHT